MDMEFNPILYRACDYLSMSILKLNHVRKTRPLKCLQSMGPIACYLSINACSTCTISECFQSSSVGFAFRFQYKCVYKMHLFAYRFGDQDIQMIVANQKWCLAWKTFPHHFVTPVVYTHKCDVASDVAISCFRACQAVEQTFELLVIAIEMPSLLCDITAMNENISMSYKVLIRHTSCVTVCATKRLLP